jgi:hypothetical protein
MRRTFCQRCHIAYVGAAAEILAGALHDDNPHRGITANLADMLRELRAHLRRHRVFHRGPVETDAVDAVAQREFDCATHV